MNSLADAYHDEHGRPLQATVAPEATHRVAQHPKTITRGGMPYQPPRPITPRPTAPPPIAEEAEKTEKRKARSRKAAQTVREQSKAERVDQAVNDSLDRIAARIEKEAEQARRDALDPPGTPTTRQLIATAREHNAEAALYRKAHEARAPWKPSQWSAETRTRLGQALTDLIATRPKKGQPK